MKLLTKELEKKLPKLYSTDGQGDKAKVIVKFFHPRSNWTWYATEYDPNTTTFFGYVKGVEDELGCFTLNELSDFKDIWGLGIERDMYWDSNTTLKEVMKK